MRKPVHSLILLGYAFLFMLLGLSCSVVTLTSRDDYRWTLLMAIGFMLLADALCLKVVLRKHLVWMIIAGVMMLPSVFILWDFFRRGPYVFGLEK